MFANGSAKFMRRDIIEDQIQTELAGNDAFGGGNRQNKIHWQIWNNFDSDAQLYRNAVVN